MKTFSNVPIVTLLFALSTLVGGCGGGSGGGDGGGGTTPTLNIADAQINEGDSGTSTLIFSVSLDSAAADVVSVDYTTSDGSATQGSDYTAASGTLNIPAGDTQANISISVNGDSDVEADETLSLTLSNLSANATAGDLNATGTILNDDSSSLPQISVSGGSVTEGDSGTVNLVFTASLSAASATDVSFNYDTADGSASNVDDYQAIVNGGGTIPVGQTQVILYVTVNGDTDVEANETLSLTLSNLSANVSAGTLSASGTILDDDAPVAAPTGNRLNDTGVTNCSNTTMNGLPCASSTDGTDLFPGQDAEVGRDVAQDDSDGYAGFKFEKLDSLGAPLADQGVDYAIQPWACVRDQVTGLIWEVKTNNPGDLRDSQQTFSWQASTARHHYELYGTKDAGECAQPGACDTGSYIDHLNTIQLCGFNDWRLPRRRELVSLIHYGSETSPMIDTRFYPNSVTGLYWAGQSKRVNYAHAVSFTEGSSTIAKKTSALMVRAVRGAEQ